MPKDRLTTNEFAINDGANLVIDLSKTQFNFTRNGNQVTMNFSMTFLADENKLQIGPGPIRFLRCGAHSFDVPNYNEGLFSNFYVSITPLDEIVLQSARADFSVLTNGDKREHGSSFRFENLSAPVK